MFGRICGTGSCAPITVRTNDDLAKLVDTSDEWIRERTGIRSRHIVKEETTVSMAAEAAKKAMENGNVLPEEIDMILVATFSSNTLLPSTACEVQKEIGASNAVCFDLNAACTGFLFAYNTAQTYIATGLCKTVLVIGAESLSNVVDWTDRGTCILFGDGAGAAVLRAEEGELLPMKAYSNGAGGDVLTCEGIGSAKKDYVHMDGRKVFEFAVRKVPEVIKELLEDAGVAKEDISLFVLHQANERIVEAVAKRLGENIEKFPMNIAEYGNTSAASIPLLLDELNRSGKIKKGDYLVLAGFGAGLSWGATLVKW